MPGIDAKTKRQLVAEARVGRLATVTADGLPHVVPCCFSLQTLSADGADGTDGGTEDHIYSVVDAKPKSTLALKRLDNVRAVPTASLVVDHYADDWDQLWWVRVDGSASIVDDESERERALAALCEKYKQYRVTPPPGALLRIDVTGWAGWTATG